jgi:hypothetical protein
MDDGRDPSYRNGYIAHLRGLRRHIAAFLPRRGHMARIIKWITSGAGRGGQADLSGRGSALAPAPRPQYSSDT